jgi:hypothetical protein
MTLLEWILCVFSFFILNENEALCILNLDEITTPLTISFHLDLCPQNGLNQLK